MLGREPHEEQTVGVFVELGAVLLVLGVFSGQLVERESLPERNKRRRIRVDDVHPHPRGVLRLAERREVSLRDGSVRREPSHGDLRHAPPHPTAVNRRQSIVTPRTNARVASA